MALTPAVEKHIARLEPDRGLSVAGTWRAAGATFEVDDPGTGQPLGLDCSHRGDASEQARPARDSRGLSLRYSRAEVIG